MSSVILSEEKLAILRAGPRMAADPQPPRREVRTFRIDVRIVRALKRASRDHSPDPSLAYLKATEIVENALRSALRDYL